jgi:Domain of unknown function (DUF397).
MHPDRPATLRWRKSSHSNDQSNCVEVTAWRKSRHSDDQGHCVEVGGNPYVVAIRDSKNPDGPMLTITPAAWRSFLHSVRSGVV